MTPERDEIEAFLCKLDGEFKGNTDDRIFVEDWLPKLLELVRVYRSAMYAIEQAPIRLSMSVAIEEKARKIING